MTVGDLGRCARVCRNWKVLIQANILWSKVNSNINLSTKFSIVLLKVLLHCSSVLKQQKFCMIFAFFLIIFHCLKNNLLLKSEILWVTCTNNTTGMVLFGRLSTDYFVFAEYREF